MTTVAADSHVWIQENCRRFMESTGWPLEYVPVDNGKTDGNHSVESGKANCCWFSEVHDGNQRVGLLQLDLPDNSELDKSFPVLRELAGLLADLTTKVLTAERILESRTDEVTTLVDIGLSIPNEDDLHSALNQLLRAAAQLTEFRSTGFFLLNPATSEMTLRGCYGLGPQQVPFTKRDLSNHPPDLDALSQGRVIIQRSVTPSQAIWLPHEISMAVCYAVQSESGPIGTLWAFDRRARTPSKSELHIFESIAVQLSAVLERVVLLQESAEQHRIQTDLKVAAESQPQQLRGSLAGNSVFDVAAMCTSRYEIGGDLCELIAIDSGRTLVAVGDASGDSVPAAMVMSTVRGALRTLVSRNEFVSTPEIMEKLNQTLLETSAAHQFMSMILGVLDEKELTFTYTNAGHPTPILFHHQEVTELDSHGMLLGILAESSYQQSIVSFAKDDVMILYSDGISEAMNQCHEMFGGEGIVRYAAAHLGQTAEDLLNGVWSALEKHSAEGGEPDDRTLAVIRVVA